MATPTPRILVPTDLSEASEHALGTALGLAERLDAEVELLAVVPKSQPLFPRNPDNRKAAERLDREEVEHAQRSLDGLAERSERITRTHVGHGTPHQVILECAKERAVEFIAMGTTGHSLAGRVLLGSTIERVLRHSHCPVLAVPRLS